MVHPLWWELAKKTQIKISCCKPSSDISGMIRLATIQNMFILVHWSRDGSSDYSLAWAAHGWLGCFSHWTRPDTNIIHVTSPLRNSNHARYVCGNTHTHVQKHTHTHTHTHICTHMYLHSSAATLPILDVGQAKEVMNSPHSSSPDNEYLSCDLQSR